MCTDTISAYTPYITGFGGVIIGGLISFGVGVKLAERNHAKALALADMNHNNAQSLAQRLEFNKAAAEFRSNFIDIIHKLRNTSMASRDDYLNIMRQFHSLDVNNSDEKAKIRFEPFIDKADISGFNAAWDDYYNWQKHINNKDANTLPDVFGHIDNLLAYAKPR